VFVEARDTKACWELLSKLFELPFFDLLKIPPPYYLQVRLSERREAAARQNRQIQYLPSHLQQELVQCEEILLNNANLVEESKASARTAAKRKLLVLGEAEFSIEEAKLERKRQALQAKRRRAEETPVQCNCVQYPSAHTRAD
jgi:hypothetical protein